MIVIPVYRTIVTPDATLFFQIEQLRKAAGGKGVSVNEKVVLIVAKDKESSVEFKDDGFYPIGLSGIITDLNHHGYAAIRTQYRVNIENVSVQPNRTIQLVVSKRNDVQDLPEDVEAEKLKDLKIEMKRFSSGFDFAESAKLMIDQIDSIGAAACVMSYIINNSNEERYAILAEDSVRKRCEMIEKMLYEYMEVGRIAKEAMTSQQREYQQQYREAAIKRQMEHLQKELDEMHPENVTDMQMFQQRIENSGMNEVARKEAEKVLGRLRQERKDSSESGMLYDYLDFVTTLSWKKESTERIDLNEAQKVLDEDHYGLKKVKERIIQQIAVMNLKNQQSGSILLFVGAPGTGKTSIGKSIARALNRKYVRVSLGGVHDESDIRGHRRTYVGSMPGRIMDGVHKSGVTNPVMVLDEVDKLTDSYHGSPASALLEVLDPEQNNTFTDHYMNVPYDLSDVLFVCTANTTDTIPGPLLDRMEVIRFQGYTPIEKMHIAKNHLVPKSMEAMGITPERMTFSDDALNVLISDFTMEAGVRSLRKCIDTLCRNLAVRISSDPDASISVTPDVVREVLDTRPVRHDAILPEPKAGVVTGLAWTPVGGDILHIEVMLVDGKGELVITGQLGDVMKESAKIALSLVKSIFPRESERFRNHDLHIHVPAGAVPKDGPSAGITIMTAIASLVTGRMVDTKIAMTGEIALRGAVLPIGGLPEKLMAAQRAGVTKVLIPDENVFDLKDVPQEVKDKIEVVPVREALDVLKITGLVYAGPKVGRQSSFVFHD